ncbi:MAG: diguanylate cyclase [Candidatus Rokubacteria bacterium]|nr:diguanylate cyclase [Candidatus Rokubacteria bacterium]
MAKRAKVLFAEGPRGDAGIVGRTLAEIGCRVKVAGPGPDLLTTARQWRPDLIILGVGKTRPAPATVLQLLRGDARTRTVPILILLDSRPSPRAWAQAARADDVVRRPVATQELAMRVRGLLRLSTLARDTHLKLKRVQAQARIDNLTGLATHGAFKDRIVRELPRAERYQRPLSLLMADVDHFKHYNDSFGHPAGDRLLRLVGRMVASQVRQVDFGARYGGDEFAVILPETSKAAACVAAERLRVAVEMHPFPRSQSQPLGKVTVSVGVATFPDDATTHEKLLEAADRALYQAKADGRNLVRGAGDWSPHGAGDER